MDKPRSGGSRDETRCTMDMTSDELMDFISIMTAKHPPTHHTTQPKLPEFYGDDDGRAE